MKLLVLFFSIGLSASAYSQETETFQIQWKYPEAVKHEISDALNHFLDNQGMMDGMICYVRSTQVADKSDFSYQITDVLTTSLSSVEKELIESYNYPITENYIFSGSVRNSRDTRIETISLVPFIKKNGQILKITQFSVIKTPIPYIINSGYAKSFANESVLRPGSGQWYKIAVREDGIYKIDKQFLSSCGINVANLNPQHIHIYGNGDGMLPVLNSAPRIDDLAQNPIYIEGEGDGIFNDNDYILFYAKGPNKWNLTNNIFKHEMNLYSGVSMYFININANTPPMRIQTQSTSPLPPTHQVTNYNYRAIHENDLFNPEKCGQRWYGEEFDVELSRNFTFSVPNATPATNSHISLSFGADNTYSNGGLYKVTVNGSQILQQTIPSGTYFSYKKSEHNFTNSNSNIVVNITMQRNNASIVGYLDYIQINTRRNLVFTGTQFQFRDITAVATGAIANFTIQNMPPAGFVWDVTDKNNPVRIEGNFSGTNYSFAVGHDILREFVASNGTQFLTPTFVNQVNHQNLHALPQADYIIVTPPQFISEANRLADLHRTYNGLTVHVVDINQIYNEFSSGAQDVGAIRRFMKMFWDRKTSMSDAPKYLCLFGDGTYDPKDRIANNNNHIPTYQIFTESTSEDPINNMVADDFFGILDDNEAMKTGDHVDIGIGRLLVNDLQNAKELVNKIEHYMKNGSSFFTDNNINCIDGVSTSTFGDWRTKVVLIADLENYFIQNDQEDVYNYVKVNHPEINFNKLYLDAYTMETTVAGHRAPIVQQELNNSFYTGALMINYVGHGSELQLSTARIITSNTINELKNSDRLPIFVSATCEFTRFDNPDLYSAGEYMATNPVGGAIALMTTTRKVAYGINSTIVENLFKQAFKRDANDQPLSLGEIMRQTKITSGGSTDRFSFTLIGDPALKIALPRLHIVIDSINGKSPALEVDTIKALSKVKVKAHLEDQFGNIMTSINGVATPSLYDKPKAMMTLGQKPPIATSIPFESQKNVIYRGQSTVTNGYFSFEFIVPKDIDYNYGNGKFSMYANSTTTDATGSDTRVIVGGVNPQGLNDNVGPNIKMYLNHEGFVNGGLTDQSPYLIAKLKDENGINTVGNGIGHDITVIIDEKTSEPIIVNEYFKNDLDSYQSGELRYQLSNLTPGRHTLTLKVWDVNNNSSQEIIEFIVQEKQELELRHVLNYPNPFTTSTDFFFEHNQCCTDLETQIQIFTVSGRLVKTINQSVYTTGYRSEGIHWDGKDDFGDELARGVYIYRLKVKTPSGQVVEKLEKLVLL